MNCPVCRNNNGKVTPVVTWGMSGYQSEKDSYSRVVLTRCDHCGFVATFAFSEKDEGDT